MKKQLTKFALAAAFWFALSLTFSCSGGGGDEVGGGLSSSSGGGSSSPSGGGGIVNADNEAWVSGRSKAYIFKPNGEIIYAENIDGNWCIGGIGLYSINGNQVTIVGTLHTYRIDVNGILTLIYITDDGKEAQADFIRTSGVYLSGNCSD